MRTWNANGFGTDNPSLRDTKFQSLSKVLSSSDVTIITETHSTSNNTTDITMRLEKMGFICHWSHGESSQQSGILIAISIEFASEFISCVPLMYHAPLVQFSGHVFSIDLFPPNSEHLRIVGIYISTGTTRAISNKRLEQIKFIGRLCESPGHVIPIGDFNFVEHRDDRKCYASATHLTSDSTNTLDSFSWGKYVATPCNLTEIHQPAHTYHHTLYSSRIDRAYSNRPAITTPDLNRTATRLCKFRLPDHRPLQIVFSPANTYETIGVAVPNWVWSHPDYFDKVIELFDSIHLNFIHHNSSLLRPPSTSTYTALNYCLATAANILHEGSPPPRDMSHPVQCFP
jgi:exonuclease III